MNHRSKFSYGNRPEQRIQSADDPDADEECGRGKLLRDLARRAQDTHADRAADRDGQTEHYAQHAEQMAGLFWLSHSVRVTFDNDRGLSGSSPLASARSAANSCAGI